MEYPQAYNRAPLYRRRPQHLGGCGIHQEGVFPRWPVSLPNMYTASPWSLKGADSFLTFSVNTYKYYINKKWKLKRNIPASKKTAILNHLQTRASIGRQTVVKYKGKTVDQKKLRRHCKSIIRAHASENAVGQILDDALTISPYTIHPSAHQM